MAIDGNHVAVGLSADGTKHEGDGLSQLATPTPEAAEQELDARSKRFSLWLWENADRERRLVNHYNDGTPSSYASTRAHARLAGGIELWECEGPRSEVRSEMGS